MYIVRWLDTTGIGYMALWGFRAKCWSGVEWMDWIPLRLLRLLEHLRCKKLPSKMKVASRFFDLLNSMIYDLKRSIDLI